jgi:Domain of unknown function (DUF4412)
MRKLLSAAVLLLAVPSLVAAEDVAITYKLMGHENGPSTATQYYSATKIRMSNGEQDTILDMAAGKIISIDNKKKEYSEMTMAEMQQAMQAASAKMEEAMKNMPPNVREMMEKRMGGMAGGAPAVEVTKGGTRTVAGYPCQEYTIAMGESVKTETCNTTAIKVPFDPVQFRKMWSASMPGLMRAAQSSKFVEQMQQVRGLPLAETTSFHMMGHGSTSSKEATEVKMGAIPASVFEPPAGYKQVESPMKKMEQRQH